MPKQPQNYVLKTLITTTCAIVPDFYLTFARKDNSLRINRLVGLLENWVMR